MKIRNFLSVAVIIFSVTFTACNSGNNPTTSDTAVTAGIAPKPAFAVDKSIETHTPPSLVRNYTPDSILLTDIVSEKTKEGEYDGGSMASVAFGVRIIVADTMYEITIKNVQTTFRNNITYKDLDKVLKQTQQLHKELLAKNVKDFTVSVNVYNEPVSFFIKEVISNKPGKVGKYKPAVMLWSKES